MKQCARCGEWAADRSRFCPECGARLSAVLAVEEGRKVLTVIFADVVGSTALGERIDAEKLRWAMQRWFHAMRRAVERHGGAIEDYRGDGVMAVFGIPAAHEDDALRAARAALDMRAAGQELHAEVGVELRVRIGLNTGAAATGSSADVGTFTTGDVVNVAARLEQSAQPGEILLGARTYRLIAHAVEAEPLGPLEVKGRRDAVTAYRLVGVAASATVRPRRAGASLVDRDDERARLVRTFERVGGAGACELCAVVGSPGVGKSRLVEEVAGGLADRATVAFGRCLPYGETLPWWPLVDALGGLLAQLGDDHPALPRAAELLDPGGRPVPPDEAQWVLRVVLERLARQRPLVLAIDDLQWADEAFLDLLDHLTEAVRDAPLLLLGTARPELLDDRPAWRGQSLALDPLPGRHAGELLHRLAGAAPISPEVRRRILEVAEGYPLFVTELVAMVQDEGEALTEVPATIQALLAARLDRLAPDERVLLGAAAVEGKAFTREHVRALLRERSVDNTLSELVRKGLIERAGDDYRFHHQLIRDAAYDALPKRTRADLHERLAAALEPRLAPGTGDELLGYHRERAVLLRRDLGETDAATARRGADNLADAARRAAQREDAGAAVALLERALVLVPDDLTLLPALGAALFDGGRMADAIAVLDNAIVTASDPETRARAGVEREFVRLEADAVEGTARALAVADAALIALTDSGARGRAWSLRAQAHWFAGSVERADGAWERAAGLARSAGDERETVAILGWRATAAVLGPLDVDAAIARCEAFRQQLGASPVADALMANPLASLHAMRGDRAAAERHLDEANAVLLELTGVGYAVSHHEALVRLLCGQPEQAEATLRRGLDRLAAMEDQAREATTAAMLAQALYAQGRWQDAAEQCAIAQEAAAGDDVLTQVIWRGVLAKLLAREDRLEEATALGRSALALVSGTDLLTHRADALLDLADVLARRGDQMAYQDAVATALQLYERKGNAVGAARSRSLLGVA